MRLPPLTDGRILRRYKRFLADIELADGSILMAHVANTGTMATCWEPGARVQISRSDNPRRKLAWTLERVDMGGGWIGVNTARPNSVMAEGISAGRIPSLAGYEELRREVTFAPTELERGQLDIGLSAGNGPDALVEVKNVTLLDGDRLCFPDAVSARGLKHLQLLRAAVAQGRRGVVLFAVNRREGGCFAPAWSIDPVYARGLVEVVTAGVEVLAVRVRHTDHGLEAAESLPVDLAAAL